jgi:L,D-peptidoglycan transpeptidase YkuD (ErfK/YbiS/YcfS/YnhG family)
VLVASGADDEATQTHLNLWERTDDGWERTATMTGRNGANGWREDRREGDRTTPAGVFSLSDAGGYLEDPGSQLPYYRDEGLRGGAEAVYGDGYANVFDYVIAIDYNRKTGVAPTENTRPLGWDAGGKIWLHVEHGSPTRGCVALDEEDMRLLLTTLDPDAAPHIAMGSEEFLAQ